MSTKLFDTFRRILGRGMTQKEVDAINAALKPDAPSTAEQRYSPTRLSLVGEKLIKEFEGCHRIRSDGLVEAYPDPGSGGDPWTIGWGSTGEDRFNGGRIARGTIWTKAQCDERKRQDLIIYAEEVIAALGPAIHNTSQEQFDALVSFHYNTGAIARATLTRKHIAGDHKGAAAEFVKWNKAGGRVMKGLTRRREAEATLYRSEI
jgi:GH24 family phage-related lysozyme (muramidase)